MKKKKEKLFSRNRKILFILPAFLLLISLQPYCYSQNKTLNLHFSDTGNEKEITLHYSILGLINYMYEPYIYKVKTNNNHLSLIIPDSISSFLMSIESKPPYNWGKNVNLYLSKGENLDIYLDTISPPRFQGNNAGLHQFMFQLKNGTGNERIEKTLQDFLNDKTTSSFFDFTDHKIKLNIMLVDSISGQEKINSGFYKYAKGIVVDDYLYRAGNIASMTDKDYLLKTDSATFFSDLNKLYEDYDALQTDGICLERKAALKGMNLIPKNELNLGLNYEFKPYRFLNKEEQEVAAASEIISYVSTGKYDSANLSSRVSEYKGTFPNSVYTSVLEYLKPLEKKDYMLAHFSKKDGFTELGPFKVNNLSDITKMFLGGQPVFIDFWATWCVPCLKEFQHKQELDPFLEQHNIGIMYVSLDFGGAYNKWRETITDKKLEGFHYLATPKIGEQLPYFKESSAIPRFILLDKDGNLSIEKCEFPSSGKLIPQIKEKLGLK